MAPGIFEQGRYDVLLHRLEAGSEPSVSHPPKPLLIAAPTDAGDFPLLVFLHGYLLYNSFYSHLLKHIASHGFIVVAPQLYQIAGADCTEEINDAASVSDWLLHGLRLVLPTNVHPIVSKAGLAGHSRGGKVAFALAKGVGKTSMEFSALIGIDPVDGMDKGKQTTPNILTYVPRSIHVNMAALVVGSGLGEVKRNPFFPPCAPKGVNHEDFFNECSSPACYFVAKDYGHLDMLDDETKGLRGKATYCLCKNGESRNPMRRFVGGIVVAFLRAYLLGDDTDLVYVRKDPHCAPLELKTVEFLV